MTSLTPAPEPQPYETTSQPLYYQEAPEPSPSNSRSGFVVGGTLLAIAVALGGLLIAERTIGGTDISHTTHRSGFSTIELIADNDVTVRVAPGDISMERIAHRGFRSPHFSVDEHGDRLVVRHECPGFNINFLGLFRCSGELHVTVPEYTNVIIRTTNGRIEVAGVAGDVEARTSNGRVSVTDISGTVRVNTSNGRIDAGNISGNLTAQTSNGVINLQEIDGNAEARTSNGRIEIERVTGDVFARTSNGAVTVYGDGEPVRLTISTSNGRQTVEGATDPNARRSVEIRSSNGSVSFLSPRH